MKRKYLFLVLLITGAALLAGGFGWQTYLRRSLSFDAVPRAAESSVDSAMADQITFIKIESLDIALPVFQTFIKDGVWEINPDGVDHLGTSANPGQNGNVVLYGHNTKKILKKLSQIEPGAVIELSMDSGRTYQYQVSSTMTVGPKEIDAVLPTDYDKLTIYTCVGWADSQRFIAEARPLE